MEEISFYIGVIFGVIYWCFFWVFHFAMGMVIIFIVNELRSVQISKWVLF